MHASPPRPAAALAAALAALAVAGCVTEGPFPSLQPREAELDISTEEPVREPADVAPDPALAARAAELLALARAGERDFEAVYPAAAAAARGAGGFGSESWVLAQQALSRAEAARGETMRALAALDLLAVERADLPTSPEDFAAVLAALERTETIAAAQEARLDALRAEISPG